MKRSRISLAAIGLACMVLFSSCWSINAQAAILKGGAAQGFKQMSSSGLSGYEHGQSLWVVNCKESISLRSKQSTSSDAILQIPLYGRVSYIADAKNGFLYVNYNGTDGYALAKYLDEFEPQIAIGAYMKVVNCKESVTLRKTASTSGKEICQIPLGSVVYAIKEGANGFFMVEYNGMQGFVLKKYLGSVAS